MIIKLSKGVDIMCAFSEETSFFHPELFWIHTFIVHTYRTVHTFTQHSRYIVRY